MSEAGETPVRGRADDADEHRVAVALRGALATRRHGEMLFDMAADLLGPAARVEAPGDGTYRRLFRIEGPEPRWVIPWPLLTLSLKAPGHLEMEIPGLKPAPPRLPRPGKAPNLRGLGPGWITIHDGTRHLQVGYEEDGRWCETCRHGPPGTLEGLLPVLAGGGAPAVERIADFVAGLDIARHGPARAYLPGPGGCDAAGAWTGGLSAIREALARGTIPEGARWVAADAFGGRALAWGATRDEALFAWSAEVERVRPGPGPPMGMPEPGPALPDPQEPWKGEDPQGAPGLGFGIHFPGPVPLGPAPPPPPPESVPGALVPLGDLPAGPPPLGEWRRFLGACGNTVPAAVRADPQGWTVVGDRVLAALGIPDIESAMDEADRGHEILMRKHSLRRPPGIPEPPFRGRHYRLVAETSGTPVVPLVELSGGLQESRIPAVDGDSISSRAVRVRPANG